MLQLREPACNIGGASVQEQRKGAKCVGADFLLMASISRLQVESAVAVMSKLADSRHTSSKLWPVSHSRIACQADAYLALSGTTNTPLWVRVSPSSIMMAAPSMSICSAALTPASKM